ncbi:DUF551 domain-containing protein [Wielerella bovis]|uniref:DUF551 domain-containing protein n=1 Tax=Wielerella bovis TaxID=2917790 RepID=UPI002019AF90|nr:DUF551 domain-containing protein [Wielerella bovis]MCG7657166.1 DUF551 domain-containing protein [Wielerella bovis]MCG7659389.1 DUF551 domain-containing protein [Wielerella bovis]
MNDLLFLTAQLADAIHLLDCMANEVDKKRGIAILEEIHTRFLSELQSGGWISVADRLPENGATVLCLLYNKEIISAKLDNTDWVSKYTKHLSVDDNYVEYWQPLPPTQKQEHENDE